MTRYAPNWSVSKRTAYIRANHTSMPMVAGAIITTGWASLQCFSSIAGLAFFKDYPEFGGALSAVVAVLTALSTFLKPSERATAHKGAGDQYLSLRNDARVFREIRLALMCDAQSAIDGLTEFSNRRNELNLASPQFSKSDFNKARSGIEAGEATHAVDQRP